MIEIFDETFHANVVFGGRQICLFVGLATDGWLGAVYYPDTRESISLCQVREMEDAKAKVEGWVRIVHKVTDPVEWIPGPCRRLESD